MAPPVRFELTTNGLTGREFEQTTTPHDNKWHINQLSSDPVVLWSAVVYDLDLPLSVPPVPHDQCLMDRSSVTVQFGPLLPQTVQI